MQSISFWAPGRYHSQPSHCSLDGTRGSRVLAENLASRFGCDWGIEYRRGLAMRRCARDKVLAIFAVAGACLLAGCGGGSSSPPSNMTISGTIVDAVSQAPLQGTFVALEQRDSQNIDRVQKVTTTDT